MRLGAFVRLGRPHFLVGGFLFYGLGAAIARQHGHAIDTTTYLLGQLAVTAFQWMTHYANDYYDYDADRANLTPTRWSGGSRVLPAMELPRHVAIGTALVLAAIGVATSILLVLDGNGRRTAITLAATLGLAWEYSAPPLRLCATGTGELATAIVVTGLVPWLGFSLQAPDLAGIGTLALAIVPLALLQLAMLVAIEIPDAAGDRATGKRTLVVRIGARRAGQLYATLTALAFVWLLLAFSLGLPARVALFAAIPAPLAIGRWVPLPFRAVLLLVAMATGMLVALL